MIKIFIIGVSYYLRIKFLKFRFELCYCQQMNVRKANLKNIAMSQVTGFVCRYQVNAVFCKTLVYQLNLRDHSVRKSLS